MHTVEDKRSMVVVPACHCLLNQNAKLEGIAGWPGMIHEIMKLLMDRGVGVLQIPCPEMIYEGIGRFDKSVEQYDCAAFREVCAKISRELFDQVENYIQWGYQVPVIIAIDGSPSCGYNLTQSAPEWRGEVAGKDWQKVRYIQRPGIMMEYFKLELENRNLQIPVLGIPEISRLGSLENALKQLDELLTSAFERR
ncbi:MAG TPA: hypothetical protein VHO48_10570 [Anaerolineaceae bacterium]|nr:hypothetical protein [Anaerolineaceae bacterium]